MKQYAAVWCRIWYLLYAVGVALIFYFWWQASGHRTTATALSINVAIGNLTGLIGTYAILWQLVLLGRLTVLENAFGLERLTWLHKWNGYLALALILVHTLLLTIGFGLADRLGLIPQFVNFLTTWRDVLQATVGTILLVVVVFISIGIVRRGLKYETWYFTHLFTYLAILLAFSHQFSVGLDFENAPAFRLYWYALYVLAIGALVWFRLLVPLWQVYYYRLRVERIGPANATATSVYITGRHLDKLRYEPGQFMIWRFFTKSRWWQAHPFSLSVAPNGQYLRLTAKAVGDFTSTLPALRPGTLVSTDGPHGNFTLSRTTGQNLLFIAGGIGITPIRAMLEHLPPNANAAVLYAARTQAELAFTEELKNFTVRSGINLHYITSDEEVPGLTHGFLTAETLRALVPDAATREVLLCGPPVMMDVVTKNLIKLGVPRHHIHTERFAY
jgi:predicted ferric reductase